MQEGNRSKDLKGAKCTHLQQCGKLPDSSLLLFPNTKSHWFQSSDRPPPHPNSCYQAIFTKRNTFLKMKSLLWKDHTMSKKHYLGTHSSYGMLSIPKNSWEQEAQIKALARFLANLNKKVPNRWCPRVAVLIIMMRIQDCRAGQFRCQGPSVLRGNNVGPWKSNTAAVGCNDSFG